MATAYSSLYLHFPFCEAKCHYCDFYSLGRERTRAEDPDRFEAALRRESERVASELAPRLETIFMGGGTPSMTPPPSMARAIEPLLFDATGASRITSDTEWTMEANPSSIDRESMKAYLALGVNRVSMGVQAMRPDLLTWLGRVHSREAAIRALEDVFAAGFDNVSVDLLCGVPGQSLADVEAALDTLTSFPITHLSCYLLTLAPHHRLYKQLPNEETQLEHLLLIDRWMTGRGFEHYEISNFARPGRRARHNLVYWTGGSYLGLGPSAHSFDAGSRKRWKNVSSLHKYASLLGAGQEVREWTEELNDAQVQLEKWMLALRLNEGFPTSWLTTELRRGRAKILKEKGLLEDHPDRPGCQRLTARGFALSDQVIAALA